ncbi:MAG: hypothetical protein QXY05_01655 [Candidatus Anstonellales archaeon]
MVKMAGDDKKTGASKIKPEEMGIFSTQVPKRTMDAKDLLSQLFSDDMVKGYKETHKKEFDSFCQELGISRTEENFEKWARLTLAWNALRYAGLFGINYKSVGERQIELGESKNFRSPSLILSQLLSGGFHSQKTLEETYSGFYSSYYDCDESAKLFRDVVDLLWPEYGAKVAIMGDGHAVVVVNFEDKPIYFDITYGKVDVFRASKKDPLISEYAILTLSAMEKNGKGLTPEEKPFWDYLPFFRGLNRSNDLTGKKIVISIERKEEIFSFCKQFFQKPQATLDLLKEMNRIYYGYRPGLKPDVAKEGSAFISEDEVIFLAEKFLNKPNISEAAQKTILSIISKRDAQFGVAFLTFTLVVAQKRNIDAEYVKTVSSNFHELCREAEKYGLSPIEGVALVSKDEFFHEKLDKGELTLKRLGYDGQVTLCMLVLKRRDAKLTKLLEENGPSMSPDVYYGVFLSMIIEKKINDENILNAVVKIAKSNENVREESKRFLASVLPELSELPQDIVDAVRKIARV